MSVSPDGKSVVLLGFASVGQANRRSRNSLAYYGSGWTADLLDVERPHARWAESICLRDVGGQLADVLLDHEVGAVYGFASWSRDSQWVAYVVKLGGSAHLWISSADGKTQRKVSELPVSTLVETGSKYQYSSPPFEWAPDSQSIVFATPAGRILSAQQRIEQFSRPHVKDTHKVGRPAVSHELVSEAAHALHRAHIVEVSIEPSDEPRVSRSEEAIFYLSYWAKDHLIIGAIDGSQDTSVDRHYYHVNSAAVDKGDWRNDATRLPVAHHRYLFRQQKYANFPGIVASLESELCEPSRQFAKVHLLCLDIARLPYSIMESSKHILLLGQGGLLYSFRKESGQLVWQGYVPTLRREGYIPIFRGLSNAGGFGLYEDEDGNVVLADILSDNGEYRSLRLTLFDPASGHYQVIIDDNDNQRGIVSVGNVAQSGSVHIQLATDAGRFNHAMLDLRSGAIKTIGLSLYSQYTYSEFMSTNLSYERADGIKLSGRIFWPPNSRFAKEGKLPLVIWQYPFHYSSESEIDSQRQRRQNTRYSITDKLDYIGEWLPLRLLEAGFAVFHYPAAPMIGEDDASGFGTFERQMIKNAEAAVRAAVATGKIDIDRIAITGHSRGGGDAALLLANTDLFKTGISIAGQMNAMLMTYAKQYDERPFWEEPDVYIRASASAKAHMVDEPILMIHGIEDDSNARSATSESLFNGIQKAGGTARLVLLPFMGHEVETQKERDIVTDESIAWLLQYLGFGEQSAEESTVSPEG